MTELLTAANLTAFDLTDSATVIEHLIFAAFNSDCNECTKAAFDLFDNLIPGFNATALVESQCGANFSCTYINIRFTTHWKC